jgi:hypothetical protein
MADLLLTLINYCLYLSGIKLNEMLTQVSENEIARDNNGNGKKKDLFKIKFLQAWQRVEDIKSSKTELIK